MIALHSEAVILFFYMFKKKKFEEKKIQENWKINSETKVQIIPRFSRNPSRGTEWV